MDHTYAFFEPVTLATQQLGGSELASTIIPVIYWAAFVFACVLAAGALVWLAMRAMEKVSNRLTPQFWNRAVDLPLLRASTLLWSALCTCLGSVCAAAFSWLAFPFIPIFILGALIVLAIWLLAQCARTIRWVFTDDGTHAINWAQEIYDMHDPEMVAIPRVFGEDERLFFPQPVQVPARHFVVEVRAPEKRAPEPPLPPAVPGGWPAVPAHIPAPLPAALHPPMGGVPMPPAPPAPAVLPPPGPPPAKGKRARGGRNAPRRADGVPLPPVPGFAPEQPGGPPPPKPKAPEREVQREVLRQYQPALSLRRLWMYVRAEMARVPQLNDTNKQIVAAKAEAYIAQLHGCRECDRKKLMEDIMLLAFIPTEQDVLTSQKLKSGVMRAYAASVLAGN